MLTPGKNYVGTEIRLTFNITNASTGALTDPTTLKVKTFDPYGTTTTYTYGTNSEVQRSSAGVYLFDVTPDKPGRWHYRLETTGSGQALASEGNFIVQDSPCFTTSQYNITGYE